MWKLWDLCTNTLWNHRGALMTIYFNGKPVEIVSHLYGRLVTVIYKDKGVKIPYTNKYRRYDNAFTTSLHKEHRLEADGGIDEINQSISELKLL